MKIAIGEIRVGPRRRATRDIASLAQSIEEVGLLNPIAVTEDMRVIAGVHRLEACKSLGWMQIDATVLSLSTIDAELAEIDENLVRNELTLLERASHLARRKELYEAKYPQTKNGGAPGKGGGGKDKTDRPETFAVDAAKKSGLSPRLIRQEVRVARKIAPDVKEQIKGTSVENSKADLLILAEASPVVQRKLVNRVASGKASSIADATRKKAKPAPRKTSGAESKRSDVEILRATLTELREAQNRWEDVVMRWKSKIDRVELIQRSPAVMSAFTELRGSLTEVLAECESADAKKAAKSAKRSLKPTAKLAKKAG